MNLAVWRATRGCGVSFKQHLEDAVPPTKTLITFHVYHQARRILAEIQAPLPQDHAWNAFDNPYDRRSSERICSEFGVSQHTDWRVKGPNNGLGLVYFYASHVGGGHTRLWDRIPRILQPSEDVVHKHDLKHGSACRPHYTGN